jgi:Ala-tRNA(Pro) deacylase
MSIAPKLRYQLDREKAVYELIEHPPTTTAIGTAAAAHIPPSCMAKAVLLDLRNARHLIAVLASNRRIDLDALHGELDERPRLADEAEIMAIFDDCDAGAVPPLGGYGVDMIVDDQIAAEPDIFFEAGDHRSLIHMEQTEFRRLTRGVRHGRFGTPAWLIE